MATLCNLSEIYSFLNSTDIHSELHILEKYVLKTTILALCSHNVDFLLSLDHELDRLKLSLAKLGL